jgi:hypothetical protein
MRVLEDTFGWRSIDIAPLDEDLVGVTSAAPRPALRRLLCLRELVFMDIRRRFRSKPESAPQIAPVYQERPYARLPDATPRPPDRLSPCARAVARDRGRHFERDP